MSTQAAASFKKAKSVRLTDVEAAALATYRDGFDKEVNCAVSIGIDRSVLNRVMAYGSGSPETVDKIRLAIQKTEV